MGTNLYTKRNKLYRKHIYKPYYKGPLQLIQKGDWLVWNEYMREFFLYEERKLGWEKECRAIEKEIYEMENGVAKQNWLGAKFI